VLAEGVKAFTSAALQKGLSETFKWLRFGEGLGEFHDVLQI
jgi:hypothetical protein